jgi:hypothetical protein
MYTISEKIFLGFRIRYFSCMMYVWMYVCVLICTYVYVCVFMCVCVCVCIYVCMYVCMCVSKTFRNATSLTSCMYTTISEKIFFWFRIRYFSCMMMYVWAGPVCTVCVECNRERERERFTYILLSLARFHRFHTQILCLMFLPLRGPRERERENSRTYFFTLLLHTHT